MTWNLKSVAVSVALAAGLVGCANPGENGISGVHSDGQIIGGTDASGKEDFSKTVVSLYNVAEGGLCTASILSNSILVTAAHCVGGSPANLVVIFGTDLDSEQLVVRPVEAYMVSPLWAARQDEELDNGDIAVVKFNGGLAPGFKPAELLSDAKALKNGTKTLLAGYGMNDGIEKSGAGRLRFAETSILNAAYTKTEVLVEQSKGKGACHGDSGGPAYVRVGGKLKLFGVTSRGVNDMHDTCGVAAAYTNILYYKTWIQRAATTLNKAAPAKNEPVTQVAGT